MCENEKGEINSGDKRRKGSRKKGRIYKNRNEELMRKKGQKE